MKNGFKGYYDTFELSSQNKKSFFPYLREKYGFYHSGTDSVCLERMTDKICVKTIGYEVFIMVSMQLAIKESCREKAAVELMKLNNKYPGLRLGLDISGYVTDFLTVPTEKEPLSEEEFIDVFERHMDCLDSHTDEITDTVIGYLKTEFSNAGFFSDIDQYEDDKREDRAKKYEDFDGEDFEDGAFESDIFSNDDTGFSKSELDQLLDDILKNSADDDDDWLI